MPLISKLAERATASQPLSHMSDNAPLPVLQSAYRKYHGTETALPNIQSDILLNMDSKEITMLVLLDLSTAFDTIEC